MAFRFQRRIQLFPGLRLNISKRGIGASAGVTGARVGIDSRGRRYSSVGIPGTGLSWRKVTGVGSNSPARAPKPLPSLFETFLILSPLVLLAIGLIYLYGLILGFVLIAFLFLALGAAHRKNVTLFWVFVGIAIYAGLAWLPR